MVRDLLYTFFRHHQRDTVSSLMSKLPLLRQELSYIRKARIACMISFPSLSCHQRGTLIAITNIKVFYIIQAGTTTLPKERQNYSLASMDYSCDLSQDTFQPISGLCMHFIEWCTCKSQNETKSNYSKQRFIPGVEASAYAGRISKK